MSERRSRKPAPEESEPEDVVAPDAPESEPEDADASDAEQPETAPEPREDDAPHVRLGGPFFVMDDFEGGAAVACGAPFISGQWVKGSDVEDAYRKWDALYEAGSLTE